MTDAEQGGSDGDTYDRSPVGQLTTRPDGTIIRANQTFLDWTGYSGESLVGTTKVQSLLAVGTRMHYETHLSPTLQMHGSATEIALSIVAADGRRLPALANAVLERDAAGDPTVMRWAIFMAEERRGYERELLAAKQHAEASERTARELTRTLQETLVPRAPPQIPGIDIAAEYRPAGSGSVIGGDFYDVFQVAADDWVVAIGDVQGKGVGAAIITSLARFTIRAAAVEHRDPADVLRLLNTMLFLDNTERLCTATIVRLTRTGTTWRATCASAGHPLPLLRRDGHDITEFGQPGPLLGFFATVEHTSTAIVLAPGDSVLLYTDGVSEARHGREWFGEQRIATVFSASAGPASAATADLLEDVLQFQGDMPRDDIAIVVFAVT